MRVGFRICSMRGARSRRGARNTTKSGRTAAWDTGRRRNLRRRRRAVEKTLRGKPKAGFPVRLEIPQKQRDSHFPTATTTAAHLYPRSLLSLPVRQAGRKSESGAEEPSYD